jgi:RNAse (barnase) inhibitor barstar
VNPHFEQEDVDALWDAMDGTIDIVASIMHRTFNERLP